MAVVRLEQVEKLEHWELSSLLRALRALGYPAILVVELTIPDQEPASALDRHIAKHWRAQQQFERALQKPESKSSRQRPRRR